MLSSTLATVVFSLASLNYVSANPISGRDAQYPEVVPGEGLPSLESLGLTTAMLYETPLPAIPEDEMSVMFDPRCGPSDYAYTNVNGIIACYNYLNGLGGRECRASGNPTTMCTSGSAKVTGQALNGNSASSCSDVAKAVLWTINSCTRPDQSCAGFQAANGNGDLIIGGVNTRY